MLAWSRCALPLSIPKRMPCFSPPTAPPMTLIIPRAHLLPAFVSDLYAVNILAACRQQHPQRRLGSSTASAATSWRAAVTASSRCSMIGSRQPGAISSRSGRAQRVPDVCPRMRAAAWSPRRVVRLPAPPPPLQQQHSSSSSSTAAAAAAAAVAAAVAASSSAAAARFPTFGRSWSPCAVM